MSALPAFPHAAAPAPYKDLCHMVLMGTLCPLRRTVAPQRCEFVVGVVLGATHMGAEVIFLDLQMIPVPLSCCHYGLLPSFPPSGITDDSGTQKRLISGIFISFLQYLFFSHCSPTDLLYPSFLSMTNGSPRTHPLI